MRSPVETRCAGVADMCMRRLYQKESRGERGLRILWAELGVRSRKSTVKSSRQLRGDLPQRRRGRALRSRTAGSQDESRCSAIQRRAEAKDLTQSAQRKGGGHRERKRDPSPAIAGSG